MLNSAAAKIPIFWLLWSRTEDLSGAEIELVDARREYRLKDAFLPWREPDYVIIDCSPTLVLTRTHNGADGILVLFNVIFSARRLESN